ncbi:hypothetical protein M011DRAFT_399495 [Sporormia fimetaria CBS 119925]|uniref:Gag1-like clamp domain-containing protein n=1 Tax=Sporormia fimetaria CBS 119925 TaxID=1340428 RepID=A0A6A6VEM5_9PLEO|nr:hypothetical protein M011DRAFT_399495 [Sporormia fimetaria CBS 119925]
MDTNQQASREARRFLQDRVRNDWDWPSVPPCWDASDEEVRDAHGFRERYYGSSAPSSEDDTSDQQPQRPTDPYKYDSPEAVGDEVSRRQQTRKQRRRAKMLEEMQWNEGLRMFVDRRDAWTGAASVKKYGARPQRNVDETGTSEVQNPPCCLAESPQGDDNGEPLIPLPPPMLEGNPIRNSINPGAYTEIFNHMVVSGRSPAVPVNLSDMTRALVVGWKTNGEWPPKAGPLDPLAGGRRRLPATPPSSSVGVVKYELGSVLSHHPHVKRGVDSVKRIFHLNGHHGNEEGEGPANNGGPS